jgi:prepilin-type processing-associated H-X9-DG protein
MRQFTLAFHHYHDVNLFFPGVSSQIGTYSQPRFNCHAVILPFVEQTPLYVKFKDSNQPPWGELSNIILPFFLCPSDSYCRHNGADHSKRSNIVVSIGDFPQYLMNSRGLISSTEKESTTGTFPFSWKNIADVTDGLSNSILCSEVAGTRTNTDTNVIGGVYAYPMSAADSLYDEINFFPINCYNNSRNPSNRSHLKSRNEYIKRTYHQFDNALGYQVFNTIMPPNSPACVTSDYQDEDGHCLGFYPPQSQHTGGVNTGFCDGSVRFINESIDTNNLPTGMWFGDSATTCFYDISPFGVWGSLGTINAGD